MASLAYAISFGWVELEAKGLMKHRYARLRGTATFEM
jgi:hypothetical protein